MPLGRFVLELLKSEVLVNIDSIFLDFFRRKATIRSAGKSSNVGENERLIVYVAASGFFFLAIDLIP